MCKTVDWFATKSIIFSGGGTAFTAPLSFAQEKRLAIANGFDQTYVCEYDPESPDFGKYVQKAAKSAKATKVKVSVSNVTKQLQFEETGDDGPLESSKEA